MNTYMPQETSTPRKKGGWNRRFFLKAAGLAAADTVVSHITPFQVGVSKPFWEALESGTMGTSTEQWKKFIEDKYRVKLISPEEVDDKTLENIRNADIAKDASPTGWDAPSIKGLADIFDRLPPHFYAPKQSANGQKHPINFVLLDSSVVQMSEKQIVIKNPSEMAIGGLCLCGRNEEKNLVALFKSSLDQTLIWKSENFQM